MSLRLSTDELERCARASTLLLSPLVHPDLDDWRAEVARVLRELFAADHALFQLAGRERLFVGDGLDEATMERLAAYLRNDSEDELRYHDPELQRLSEKRRGHPEEAFTRAGNEHLLGVRMERTSMYAEACRPAGMVEFQGLFVPSPAGDAMLWVSRRRPAPAFGDEPSPLLGLLLPSFRAGLEVAARLHAYRASLDSLAEPVLINDRRGELFLNAALREVLAGEPDGTRVRRELEGLARALLRNGATPPAAALIEAPGGRYRVRCAWIPAGLYSGEEAVLLGVAAERPRFPAPSELRERFGLTAREAEVALHLAAGASEKRLAAALAISPNTARHHTERVFEKLGIRSRAKVAARLLQLAAPRP